MPTGVTATDSLPTQEKSGTLGLLPLTALVVASGRARKRSDIGKATLLGFATVLLLSLLVSLGVMSQPELAALPAAASMANLLEAAGRGWASSQAPMLWPI
jgi:hypothetical protein